jgi:PHP family Zn ribbon phosphoesterase
VDCIRAELHVHTVLSPCAEVEMIPPLIVQEALERGIKLIAITDHNASSNVAAVQKAAASAGLTVLPGMEVQTREEVHVLCLFDTLAQISSWQAVVDKSLPAKENNPDYFGEQFIVDETGEFISRENRLLLNSVDLSFERVFELVNLLGGLAIPAHVDRTAFGLFANLGLVPADVPVEALEISRNVPAGEAVQRFPQLKGYPILLGGDAHRLDEFLGANEFCLAAPSVAEIRLALRGQKGRSLVLRTPTDGQPAL